MTQPSTHSQDQQPDPAATHPHLTAPAYEAPAIIHRGKLELRAGSPLAIDPDGFSDPNNPFQ